MFFRDKNNIVVCKLYAKFILNEQVFKLVNFLNHIENILNVKLSEYCINNKSEKTYSLSNLKNETINMYISDFDSLYLYDTSGKYGVSINRNYECLHTDDVILEFRITLPYDDSNFSREKHLMVIGESQLNLLYGYSRSLPGNYDSATESKIKRGMFGGVEVKVRLEAPNWLVQPEELCGGAIKGIYPLNYWNTTSLTTSLLKMLIENYSIVTKNNFKRGSIFKISDDVLKNMSNNEKAIKKFIRK